MRVWDISRRIQIFGTQSGCEFRNCDIRRVNNGLTLFSTASDGKFRLWRIFASVCGTFLLKDYREVDIQPSIPSVGFKTLEVSSDGKTIAIVLSSGSAFIIESESLDIDNSRVLLDEIVSDLKFCQKQSRWILATKSGKIYAAFYIDHLLQLDFLASASYNLDGLDIANDILFLYCIGQKFFFYCTLESKFSLKQIDVAEYIVEVFKNNSSLSGLKTKSHVIFPITSEESNPSYKIVNTHGIDVTTVSISSNCDICILGDDAGRIHIFSPYSSSNFRFASLCTFFDFENDDIIYDEHGYSISVPKKIRIENITPKRSICINFEQLNRHLYVTDEVIDIDIERDKKRQSQSTVKDRETKSLDNQWLLFTANSLYVPQIFDRVTLFPDQIDASKSISNSVARLIDGQPFLQTLTRSNYVAFGTIVDIQIDVGSINSGSVSLKLDICVVESFQNMEDDEIPLTKTHISLIYNPLFESLRHSMCLFDHYILTQSMDHPRGEKLQCIFEWNVIEPVLVLGESRSNTGSGDIKVRRLKTGLVAQVISRDLLPFSADHQMPDSPFKTLCKSFARKLRPILKTTKYQKTLNLVDYLLEGKDESFDVSLPYPITTVIILKRLENSYYRRLDSLKYDWIRYKENLSAFNDDLAIEANESANSILTLIKNNFKPRSRR